jgi:hypothetical protein
VKNVESLQEEVSSYQSLTTNITSQSVDKLFDTLMREDFTPHLIKGRHTVYNKNDNLPLYCA